MLCNFIFTSWTQRRRDTDLKNEPGNSCVKKRFESRDVAQRCPNDGCIYLP